MAASWNCSRPYVELHGPYCYTERVRRWTLGIIHTCDREIGCTFELWDQTVTLEEWLESSARLVANPEWPVNGRQLTDLRTSMDISNIYDSDLDEVSNLFAILGDRIEGMKLAIVSESGHRRPGLFADFVSGIGVSASVFPDVKSACDWLGINPDAAENILCNLRTELRRRPTGPGMDPW